jgi:hypothetical protein
MNFIYSFSGEWLKKKRSASSFLIVAGALLLPALVIIARMDDPASVTAANGNPRIWELLYNRCWQFMGLFLLPMGVILATSLITQIEFRNNTWKQLCTTPQTLTTIFLAKLAVILVMLLEFFVLFNTGIWLTGILPSLFFGGGSYPAEALPFKTFLYGNARFFLDCLPIVALQYGISLRWKNFLIPLGVGLGFYVASMVAVHWRYGYTIPYTYCAFETLGPRALRKGIDIHWWAAGYSLALIVVAYIIYITRKEKG